jgi:hypothetical protein
VESRLRADGREERCQSGKTLDFRFRLHQKKPFRLWQSGSVSPPHWNLKTNQSQTAATLPQTKPRIQITRTDHIAFASRPFLTRKQGQHNDADTFPKSLQRPGHGTLALEQSRPYILFHHIRRKDCRVSSGAFLRENDTHAFPHLKESGDTRRLLHILLGVWLFCFWSFLGTAWALEGLLWGWGRITGSVSYPYPM